jgi:hypothetical protein
MMGGGPGRQSGTSSRDPLIIYQRFRSPGFGSHPVDQVLPEHRQRAVPVSVPNWGHGRLAAPEHSRTLYSLRMLSAQRSLEIQPGARDRIGAQQGTLLRMSGEGAGVPTHSKDNFPL